jgi:hypothetical protein
LGAICEAERPPERLSGNGHRIACHISQAELTLAQKVALMPEVTTS